MGEEIWIVFFIYCLLTLTIAHYLGRNRQIGFGWSLFFSFFLSPLGGLIITLLSAKDTDNKQAPSTTKKNIGWILIVFFLFGILMKLITLEDVPSEHLLMQINSIFMSIGFVGLGYYLILLSKGNTEDVIYIVPEVKDPLEILKSLHDSGVLTTDEYEEKLRENNYKIQQEEERIEKESERLFFERLLDEKVKPLVALIEDAKGQGVLSEEEFQRKRNEIVEGCTEEVRYILSCRPKMSDINDEEILLKYRDRIKHLLLKIRPDELLVYAYSNVKIITKQRWQIIQKSYEVINYRVLAEYIVPDKKDIL